MDPAPNVVRKRTGFVCCSASGALMGMLPTSCGLSVAPQSAPAVPLPIHGLQPVPHWVVDRMTSEAPDLYFDLKSHVLRTRERRRLDQIAPALQNMLHASPELILVIEGHNDDRKLREYNQELGSERADAVRRVLLNRSFPEDRVRAVGFGDRAPQCLTSDAACRQKNRRLHFRTTQAMRDARVGK